MPRILPSDATIQTVWPHLTHQKAYVSGALHKMRNCREAHGKTFVRIGVTGTGQKPYYRVFYLSADGQEQIFGSFYDNHDELENGHAQTHNWSTAAMSIDELLHFYADAIGFKGELK